jgi:hypothetical protein
MTDTQTLTLAEFLLARIAEDEAEIAAGFDFATLDSSGWMGHAATWGRDRALAECEAKRRIVEEYREACSAGWAQELSGGLNVALRCLALPYAAHPDYREEWRP